MPRHKCDCERAQAITALGYPAVAPVLRELLQWIQDCNWPVSYPIARFLASVGEPVAPLVWEVLRGNDADWKYWCIDQIIAGFPREVAEQFRGELQRLAFHATDAERLSELDERARAVLGRLDEAECCDQPL